MTTPLSGIRVLDLTNVLAGPFCCHQLCQLGAEVIKVEEPQQGDLARQLGADAELSERGMGVSFLAQNAGKQSLALNLKHPEGKQVFEQLVATADVLVENFRPGVMTRLGLDYPHLKAINPKLIYCAISGFGQDGPWVERPAYDQIIQGASGLMSITGDDRSAPLRVGYPIADTVGGLTAAFAISAALNETPRGALIDVSMLESLLTTMGWVVSNYLIAGQHPEPRGNENPTSAPSGTFETADGLLNIAANQQAQWQKLIEHLGVPELGERDEFRDRESRKRHRLKLKETLEVLLKQKPARQWEQELNARGIPAGAVLDLPAVLAEPQIRDRGLLKHFVNAKGVDRDIDVLTTGIKYNQSAPSAEEPPPQLGENSYAIMKSLGLSDEHIETLRYKRIVTG